MRERAKIASVGLILCAALAAAALLIPGAENDPPAATIGVLAVAGFFAVCGLAWIVRGD